MSRRVSQPNIAFKSSTVFLDFPRSDGDSSVRPTNIIYSVDTEGQVNFHEPLDVEGSGHAKKWRAAIGKAVATKLEMQGDCMPYILPSDRPDFILAGNNYVLRSWPAGYQMYDHHKGPAVNPRHDLYLYGGLCVAQPVDI